MSALAQTSTPAASSDRGIQGEIELSMDTFRAIANLIQDNCGIQLPERKIGLVRTRLQRRIRELGIPDYNQYLAMLNSSAGEAELPELISVISTNVTSFNREPHHFDHLRQVLIPTLIERLGRNEEVMIWSAGCSNGSEPYTIACEIMEAFPNVKRSKFKILGTDIDQHSLSVGKSGLYPHDMVSKMDQNLVSKYFTQVDGKYQIADAVRELVTFKQLNLMHDWPLRKSYDAIFCRNVMIYFSQEDQEKLMMKFSARLKPEAFFYIGHSERLVGPAERELVSVGPTTYQKKR